MTGPPILFSIASIFVVVATAVDGIVVLDEGAVADGREVIIPGSGCGRLFCLEEDVAGSEMLVWRTRKGSLTKCPKKDIRRADFQKKR